MDLDVIVVLLHLTSACPSFAAVSAFYLYSLSPKLSVRLSVADIYLTPESFRQA
jgi:hypothetical protein